MSSTWHLDDIEMTSKLSNENTQANTSSQKWSKDFNRLFSKEVIQMGQCAHEKTPNITTH